MDNIREVPKHMSDNAVVVVLHNSGHSLLDAIEHRIRHLEKLARQLDGVGLSEEEENQARDVCREVPKDLEQATRQILEIKTLRPEDALSQRLGMVRVRLHKSIATYEYIKGGGTLPLPENKVEEAIDAPPKPA